MRTYVIQRLLLAVPTLFGITVLIFVAMRVIPGDPLKTIYFEGGGARILSEEEYRTARQNLGLDRPLYVQYLGWMADVFRGDMGKSFWHQKPIRETIQRRGAITVEYAFMAVVISWIVGLPVGLIAAVWRNSWLDYAVRFFVTLFMAIRSFWLGLTVILVTVLVWSWRPPLGIVHLWDNPIQNMQIVLGPAIVIGVAMGAILARMARATLLEVFREDYVRTARSKGLAERVVVVRHALRNALLPVLTISGLQLAALLGGSVAVERAFSVPGLGFALVKGIQKRDWVIVQNVVLLYGVVFVFINLAIAFTGIAGTTRVIRSVVLSVREMAYVEGARALGASQLRIMIRHVAPQCIAPLIVVASASLGGAIFAEAALSFLGLGIPPPHPSLGNMLGGVLGDVFKPPWWLVIYPGVAITIAILAFNIFGDGLRDHLDPRLRGRLD